MRWVHPRPRQIASLASSHTLSAAKAAANGACVVIGVVSIAVRFLLTSSSENVYAVPPCAPRSADERNWWHTGVDSDRWYGKHFLKKRGGRFTRSN